MRTWAAVILAAIVMTTVSGRAQSAPAARRLSFGDAVAIALVKSPQIISSADRLEIANIQERSTEAQFDLKFAPTLTTATDPIAGAQRALGLAVTRRLTTGGTVYLDASSVRYGSEASPWNSGALAASISQPLLGGVGVAATNELTDARRATTSATRSHAELRQQLVLSVAASYFAVARSNRLANLATLAYRRAEQLRIASEARAKVGLATQLDVLRAELLVSQTQAILATEQESASTMLDRLKRLVGEPLSAEIEIGDESELTKLLAMVDPVKLPADPMPVALEHRLELIEARDRVDDARRQVRVARINLLPRVDLTASYRKQVFTGGPPLTAPMDYFGGWRIGLTTSYPLDRATRAAAFDMNTLAVESAQRAQQQAIEDVSAEVRAAQRAWIRGGEVAAIQQKAVELAEKQLRLAQLRYERGLAGNFDVIDAEANVYHAQSSLIDAQIDRLLAALSLHRAVGLLQPEEFAR